MKTIKIYARILEYKGTYYTDIKVDEGFIIEDEFDSFNEAKTSLLADGFEWCDECELYYQEVEDKPLSDEEQLFWRQVNGEV